MPEVAVTEDHYAMPVKHDVRPTGQLGNIKPITEASTPEFAA
jgi:hypothetical protein